MASVPSSTDVAFWEGELEARSPLSAPSLSEVTLVSCCPAEPGQGTGSSQKQIEESGAQAGLGECRYNKAHPSLSRKEATTDAATMALR